jgi:hypothetical protein
MALKPMVPTCNRSRDEDFVEAGRGLPFPVTDQVGGSQGFLTGALTGGGAAVEYTQGGTDSDLHGIADWVMITVIGATSGAFLKVLIDSTGDGLPTDSGFYLLCATGGNAPFMIPQRVHTISLQAIAQNITNVNAYFGFYGED